MRIRFKTTIDDLIAFNSFHFENSPAMRRQRLVYQMALPFVLAAVGVYLLMSSVKSAEQNPTGYLITAAIIGVFFAALSVGWLFFSRKNWMGKVERNVRKLYSEGNNRGVLGWREMELIDGHLMLKMEFIESKIDVRAIDRIVGNGEFTFVYMGSAQAHLIPMNLYPEEEYRQFVAELRQAWEARNDAVPHDAAMAQREDRIMERPIYRSLRNEGNFFDVK